MGSTGIQTFPIPIFLQNEESASTDQIWPAGTISPESVSPLSASPPFDEGPPYCSVSRLVDDIRADVGLHQEEFGLNPIIRFQTEAGNAPFAPLAVSAGYGYTDNFVSPVKVDPDQLYMSQLAGPYRHDSPVGSDSAYSGGGTFSSAGSEVYQSTPRSSVGSQQALSQQWYNGSVYAVQSPEPTSGAETVNPGLIQPFADVLGQTPEPDAPCELDEPSYHSQYGIYASNAGYVAEEVAVFHGGADNGYNESQNGNMSPTLVKDEEEEDQDDNEGEDPTFSPSYRTRKPRTSSSASSPRLTRRQTGPGKKSAPVLRPYNENSKVKKGKGRGGKDEQSDAPRAFPCPLAIYGCQSRFTAKNEWKRHIGTQHVKTAMWRCDKCPTSADPKNPNHNDFNRKDLFTQHLRRMHGPDGPEAGPTTSSGKAKAGNTLSDEAVRESVSRCHTRIRATPPQSSCIVCSKTFNGQGSWEERIEHIANAHFEKDKKSACKSAVAPANWRRDTDHEQWLLDEGLIEHDARSGWRLGNGVPRRPQHTFV